MKDSRKILIVDGNPATTNAANEAAGGQANGVQYTAVLKSLASDIETVIVHPADDGVDCLPADMALQDFDGIAWTGSALNIYDEGLAITAQLALAEQAWNSGVPNFGSCWGLQVFASALGGRVHKNPLGREVGIARCIHLTTPGVAHPMYVGKPRAFDALAVHTDEVVEPPAGAMLLASNAMSQWQAMAIEDATNSFWGVQYHPEMDLGVLAVIVARYGQRLVDDGLFNDIDDLRQTADDWQVLHRETGRRDLAFRYGITPHIVDRSIHQCELANWLVHRVGCRRMRGSMHCAGDDGDMAQSSD